MKPTPLQITVAIFAAFFTSLLTVSAAKGPQPTICDRACWGARNSSCSGTISSLNRAIIHHTAGPSDYNVSTINDSKARMRATQNYHMDSRGWCDIGYHFLVDKLGNIFEARKNSLTGMPRGAHDGVNNNSFGFTLLGYFHPNYNHEPTPAMRTALYSVIAWRMPSTWSPYGSGSYNSKTVGYLDGHQSVVATACPGNVFWPYIGSNYNGGEARNRINEMKNVPNAPSGLTATMISTNQINLSWTDNSNTETGHKIERALSASGPWTQIATVGANVKTYQNTGLSMNTTYYYRVRAYSSLGDSAYSNVASATTKGPGPTITAHPQTQTKDPGQNVTFQVTATGTGTLTYQWLKNGSNLSNNERINGVTTPTLSITSLQATDAGAYSVRVTDSLGAVVSGAAQLYLNAIVVFEENFESATPLANWTVVSGASTLDIGTAPTARGKSALVNSSLDKMARSVSPEVEGRARATFWMYDNMGSQTRWFGEVRSYSGNGYNSGSLLQLFAVGRYSVGFGTGTGTLAGETVDTTKYQGRVVSGANAGWFNLNVDRSQGWHKFEIERAADGTTVNFYVDGVLARTITGATYQPWDSVVIGSVAAGSTAGDAWFDDIKLEYFNPPTIVTQPESVSTNLGSNVTFTVVATNNVEGYQWRFEGVNIPGATQSSYTRSNVQQDDAGAYSVVVINRAGTVTSANATLELNLPPAIQDHPEDAAVAEGGTTEFTVTATGTGLLSYQWMFEGANITGATASRLVLSNVQPNQAGSYTVRVSNAVGSVESNPATLTVLPPQAPEFSVLSLSDGSLSFSFVGDQGVEYVIETSTNLVNWEVYTNIVLTDGSASIEEAITNAPSRFFRAYRVE